MKNKYNLTENEQQILQSIIEKPGLSKANIAEITQLNKSTVTYIVQKLLVRELVVTKRGTNASGRIGNYLYFNNNLERVLFLERRYNLLKVKISNLNSELQYEQEYKINENFFEILKSVLAEVKIDYPDITSSIFAVHGRIDSYQNIVKSPFFEMDLMPIRKLFDINDIKLHVENEAKVHALGLGRHNLSNVVLNIQIMEGIGSGIIINNQLFDGSNGMAGEIAHTIAVPNGLQCKCGNKGCLELYVSDLTSLQKLNRDLNIDYSIKDVSNLKQFDNLQLLNILDEEIKLLSNLINNLYVTINPDEINITSRIYSQIDGFSEQILSNINFRNTNHTHIRVVDYDPNTNLRGFCDLYLKLIFGFIENRNVK